MNSSTRQKRKNKPVWGEPPEYLRGTGLITSKPVVKRKKQIIPQAH
jgi:hypothetical protein